MVLAPFPLEDSMDEQRRYAIPFCRNDPGRKETQSIHATKGPRESEGVAADSRELAARSGGTNGWMK